MKPGKVGVAIALSASLAYNAVSLTEIPKLEERVDELTVQNEAKKKELELKQKELEKVLQETKQLQSTLQAKDVQVKEYQAKVSTLEKALTAKDKELKSLKKKNPVGTVSRGQNYREAGVVGENFEVTWYNDYGYTKSGRFVTDGVTIAVDPNVIPLGTWVKLTFPDGREMIRRADDTGSAVKGHIIDVYDNAPTSVLLERGRTHGVKVTILRKY